jgi:hypothetical protein
MWPEVAAQRRPPVKMQRSRAPRRVPDSVGHLLISINPIGTNRQVHWWWDPAIRPCRVLPSPSCQSCPSCLRLNPVTPISRQSCPSCQNFSRKASRPRFSALASGSRLMAHSPGSAADSREKNTRVKAEQAKLNSHTLRLGSSVGRAED